MEGKDLWQVTSKKSTVPVFLRLTIIKKKYTGIENSALVMKNHITRRRKAKYVAGLYQNYCSWLP